MNNALASLMALACMSVIYVNAVSGLERLRLTVSHRQVSSVLGVFTFAGVVTLPAQHLLALVALVYVTAWPTFRRSGSRAHRYAYSAFSVALASCAAQAIYTNVSGLLAVPAAIAAYVAVNAALIAAVIAIARHHHLWPMLRSRQLYSVLCATLSLGAATGFIIEWHPLAGAAGMPVLALVHLRTARRVVEEAGACRDGTWNRSGWLTLTEEAHRLGDWFSVVLIDVAGAHEANVAIDIIHARFGDGQVGRYNDTQIVVLLRETPAAAARYLAMRLAVALGHAGLHPGVGAVDNQETDVPGMLAAAAAEAVICRSEDAGSTERR